nr:hypothetical protein CFP56_14586 [Quercus suber]
MERKLLTTKELSSQGANVSNSGKRGVKDNLGTEAISMETEPSGVVFSSLENSHSNESSDTVENSVDLNNRLEVLVGQSPYPISMQNVTCNELGVVNSEGLHGTFSFSAKQSPLTDITNQEATQPLKISKKKWTKLLLEVRESNTRSDMEIQEIRRLRLEASNLSVRKKKRVNAVGDGVLLKNITSCQDNLSTWNRVTFGHVRNSVAKKLKELSDAEEASLYSTDLDQIERLRPDLQVWLEDCPEDISPLVLGNVP